MYYVCLGRRAILIRIDAGWRDVRVDACTDNHGEAYGVGVRKGMYGVAVCQKIQTFVA